MGELGSLKKLPEDALLLTNQDPMRDPYDGPTKLIGESGPSNTLAIETMSRTAAAVPIYFRYLPFGEKARERIPAVCPSKGEPTAARLL